MLPYQDKYRQIESPSDLRPLDGFEGSLAMRTYVSLRKAILDLALRPGEPLRKAEICAALGVSRSPVSEAIARLAAEKLVVVVPQAERVGSCAARPFLSRLTGQDT